MLQVRTPEEVLALIRENFAPISDREERVSLDEAVGRVLSCDVQAGWYVPDFNRSTVDGYACRACDTFGCSEAIPAILSVEGEILMGQEAAFELKPGKPTILGKSGNKPLVGLPGHPWRPVLSQSSLFGRCWTGLPDGRMNTAVIQKRF